MIEPLVYIILLNYNGYADTIDCVESLEKITYNNYKIIIVDNNSSDCSEIILRKTFHDIKIIQTNKNIGFSGGNNVGIKFALKNNADYVLLLNNDTIVNKDFLKILIDNTINLEGIGITISKIYYNNEKQKIWYAGGRVSNLRGNVYHNKFNQVDNLGYEENEFVTFATGCCMLIHRNVIENVGYLCEKYFLYYEDADFCCRVIKKGYKILYCPKSFIYHKISSSTGLESKLTRYYLTRNRNIFIGENIPNFYKIPSFLYYYCYLIVIFFSTSNKKIIYKALRDFLHNNLGRQV